MFLKEIINQFEQNTAVTKRIVIQNIPLFKLIYFIQSYIFFGISLSLWFVFVWFYFINFSLFLFFERKLDDFRRQIARRLPVDHLAWSGQLHQSRWCRLSKAGVLSHLSSLVSYSLTVPRFPRTHARNLTLLCHSSGSMHFVL